MSPANKLPPGPPSRFLVGNALELRRDGPKYILDVHRRYGDVACYRIMRWKIFLLSHPDFAQHVLKDNQKNYNKNALAYRLLRVVLGDGLITSDGDFWRRQRRLAAPAFTRRRIAIFGETMARATLDLIGEWEDYARRDETINIGREMSRVTLRISGETLFSINLTDEADEFGQALTTGLTQLTSRFLRPFSAPLWIPTPENRRFHKTFQTMDELVYSIIAQRRGSGSRDDLLSMLIAATDEDTGDRMTDKQLRDEVFTIMLASHETSANALTWTFYLLSEFPEVEARVREEIAAVLGGRTVTMDDLSNLAYTTMVLQESLRLYPPVYSFHRGAIEDDEIGGYPVPSGQGVAISPFIVHRHPDFWPEPERFDPERFTPERIAERHRFAHIPFADGPRFCIGNHFAMSELHIVLVTILQRFRLRLIPGQVVEPYAEVTLRPREPIRAVLERVT